MTGDQNSGAQVVVIDDDAEVRSMIADYLAMDGFSVHAFGDGSQALRFLKAPESPKIELVISDLRMPEVDGLTVLSDYKPGHPEVPVILMTAYASVSTAVEGMRKGAFDYLTKPFQWDELSAAVKRAINFGRAKQEMTVEPVLPVQQAPLSPGEIIGQSEQIKVVRDLIDRASQCSSSVLITGESGTGKEAIARALHQRSQRRDRPFVSINCSALSEQALEIELFGQGDVGRRGLLEDADGGTLFLDEIGDLAFGVQNRISELLQNHMFTPVDSKRARKVDIRLIAATHKDLKKAIDQGLFREDLYYSLAVIPIALPPLRQRPEDIPLLATHFLQKYSLPNGDRVHGFSPEALKRLQDLSWPGNVRELESVVERLAVLSRGEMIEASEIPLNEVKNFETFFGRNTTDLPPLEELERRYIHMVLQKTGSRKEKAAQILGINRRTLYRKEREYGFVEPPVGSEVLAADPKLEV